MWPKIFSRTTGATSADGPSRTIFFWLISAFLLTLLPHIAQMPSWLTISILVASIVRCVAELRRWPLPTTTSTGVVALCLLAGIFLQFHTVLGRDAGTPFMAGLLAIKFYELRGSRDITLIIFSSFFVVMSALLFSQAIELFIYCLIMMWLLTGILLRTYMGDRSDNHLLRMLRLSSMIFLQALPMTLLLFFFFPRYSHRFQLTFNETTTGLSDHVDPGSVARLANDDSPAMRVYFSGSSVPMAESMYWRAIVLWQFDGRTWTRGPAAAKGQTILADLPESQPTPVTDSDRIQQTIVLWPQNQRWVPALDRPITKATDIDSNQPWSDALTGDVLVAPSDRVIDYKRRYKVTSSSITIDRILGTAQKNAALQLPSHIDPRVQALADQLYPANHETLVYVRAVFRYFNTQHFRLSTEPGRLDNKDPVAEFLFQTKTGFCEHYASAFGLLMRLKGVPCRMVLGYRGGEKDTYASPPFYLVTQSNAHAWNEVWVAEKNQWEREDPTTAVSIGSSDALAAAAGNASDDDDLSFSLADHHFTLLSGNALPHWLRHSLRDIQMRRQEMEAQWDDWVFSYDPGAQDRLAQALGFGRYAWAALLAGCVAVAGLVAAAVYFFFTRKKSRSPVEEFYVRFCKRMAQRGVPRRIWEGPLAYTERLSEKFPTQKRPIEAAGWIVAEYRYGTGEKQPTGDLKSLLIEVSERS